MKSVTLPTLALTLLLPLAACTQSGTTGSPTGSPATPGTTDTANEMASPSWIASKVRNKMQEARQELATKNIKVNSVHIGNHHDRGDSRPDAEITPQGDLLIAGKKVDATLAQHAMLLDYRQQIVGIAEKGMDIGAQGADLGVNAASAALRGAFSGKSDKEIEAAIKPQTDKLRSAAVQLCERLPDLLASQQKLADAMPAFKPYATMTAQDIDDCRHGARNNDPHSDH